MNGMQTSKGVNDFIVKLGNIPHISRVLQLVMDRFGVWLLGQDLFRDSKTRIFFVLYGFPWFLLSNTLLVYFMAILQKLIDDSVYPLNLSQLGIGRANDNEIVILDDAVSSYHALITVRESPGDSQAMEYILEDLDSTNSTYVNSKAIKQHKLRNGDIVRVGETRLKFLTKNYALPQRQDFESTRKLSKHKLTSFANKKK